MNLGEGYSEMMPPTCWRETTKEETSQVWCGWGLGQWSYIALGLTLFLVEGMAEEWHDAPSSSTPVPVDSPWPAPSKDPQDCFTYMGGAKPKVPAKPSAGQYQSRPKEGPDPVNYPHRWITVEMTRLGTHHIHWWKEMGTSGRAFMGPHAVKEGYNDYEAQHYVQWQAAAFRLSDTQQ